MKQVTSAEVKINRAESRLLSGLDISIEHHEEPLQDTDGGRVEDAGKEPDS